MKTLPVYLRLIKVSVTVLFWLTVLSIGLVGLLMVKSTKFGGSPTFTIDLPNVILDDAPAKVVKETSRHLSFGNTAQAKIGFYYPDPAQFREDFGRYVGQFLLPSLTLLALMLIGFWQVKRIFDTLGTSDVFSKANVRRIRVIACLLITSQLLPGILWLFIQFDVIALLDMYKIRYRISQEIKIGDMFITGVLLLGLAEVFRSGVQLKQEQDLTI